MNNTLEHSCPTQYLSFPGAFGVGVVVDVGVATEHSRRFSRSIMSHNSHHKRDNFLLYGRGLSLSSSPSNRKPLDRRDCKNNVPPRARDVWDDCYAEGTYIADGKVRVDEVSAVYASRMNSNLKRESRRRCLVESKLRDFVVRIYLESKSDSTRETYQREKETGPFLLVSNVSGKSTRHFLLS